MQKDSSNRHKLSQELLREESLNNLYQQAEFQQILLPLLEQELTPPLLNPKDYPSLDKFLEAYNLLLAKALVYKELLLLFKEARDRAQAIRSMLEAPQKDFSVGNG